jgi:uncharacterized damage-inducible protein DinB
MRPPFTIPAATCGALFLVCAALHAQNPVASAVRFMSAHAARDLMDAADEMPADKYGYKPTPAQMGFGQVVLHVADGSAMMCGWIAGTKPPDAPKLTPEDGKEKLLARQKDAFAFCGSALAQVDDSKLADSIPFFGGRKMTRAAVMIILVDDLADHYSQEAIYLRLNGLLPPSAKRKEM